MCEVRFEQKLEEKELMMGRYLIDAIGNGEKVFCL
jgi:hypothetical protein